MEKWDLELIRKLISENDELRLLMEEHVALERELEYYLNKPYLTPLEELEVKRLKKLKLFGKDRIEEILEAHRRCTHNGRLAPSGVGD